MAANNINLTSEALPIFADIIGQDRALGNLQSAMQGGRLSHALAFVGPAGVGRGTTARRLAAWLLANGQMARGQGESSQGVGSQGANELSGDLGQTWQTEQRLMDDQAHPDFLALGPDESMAKPEIKVEAARRLVSFMQQTPSRSPWRVALVEQAEKFNRQAANGILKVLEEPPAKATIILLVSDLEQVLPTIRSRVTAVPFQRLSNEAMTAIAASLGQQVPEAALRASGGSLAVAQQLADPKASEAIGQLQAAVMGRLGDDKLQALIAWCVGNAELAQAQVLQRINEAARSTQNQVYSRALANAYFEIMTLDQRRQSFNLDASATWLEIFTVLKKCAKAAAGR